MRIKICGLTRPQDIAAVNAVLPDYCGFVFAQSRRRVDAAQAAALCEPLDRRIGAVGVFVDNAPQTVAEIAARCGLSAVQLHGNEDADYLRALRRLLPAGCAVWKAVRVRGVPDIRTAELLPVDCLLYDAFSAKQSGGTGAVFDWSFLEQAQRPFFLAGGINCENVLQAARVRGAEGVDVSSGAETDGVKDAKKIAKLVKAVRSI